MFEPSPPPELVSPDDGDIAVEDKPVKKRRHPGYEPVGVRAGAWMFSPTLTAGGFYDSNVFSSSTQKTSDVAALTEALLSAQSLWENHALKLEGGVRSYFYRQNSGLDQTDASLKGHGRFDIDRDLAVLASFQASSLHDGVGSLTSPSGAVEPTPYTYVTGDVTVRKQFNRLTGAVGARFESYNFGSTRAQNGAVIDQSSRDGEIYAGHGRLDYAVSPMIGLFAAAEVNHRNIRGLPGQPLDSNGYRVLAGVDIELTRLITAEFGVGHLQQRFEAPGIATVEGPAWRALVTWRPTRLIDVHAKAEQRVTQTSDTVSSGVLQNIFEVGFDYEFRRNIVVALKTSFERDKFQGLDRQDDVLRVAPEIKYLLNDTFSVTLRYDYTSRNSNVPSFSYDKHQVGIDVRAQL